MLYNCISLFFIIGTEGRPTSSEQIIALPNAAYERVNINPAYGELAATQNVTYEEITWHHHTYEFVLLL